MRVVFVHRGMYPERIGGTYSYVYELGRRLAASGHAVHVIAATRRPEAQKPFDLEGMTIHSYAYRKINPIASTLQHLSKTASVFDRIDAEAPVDILSVNDSHLGARLARSRVGTRLCQVPTYHAPFFLEFRYNTQWQITVESSPLKRAVMRLTEPPFEYWQKRYEAAVLGAAHRVIVLSRYTVGHIETNFSSVDVDKVRVIPGGVDTDRFSPASSASTVRQKLGLSEGCVYLVTVRNLNPRMGLENLVDAMAMVSASEAGRDADVRLLICGDGPLRKTLESRVAELGLARRVTLVGRVTDSDLVAYYQAADAFVLPTSAMEGFGISTVEALSTNLPVIGTPAGATPEILMPIDQRLVTSDTSADAIADGIVSWLGWRREDACSTRYRDEVLKKYSWDAIAKQTEDCYREAMEVAGRHW